MYIFKYLNYLCIFVIVNFYICLCNEASAELKIPRQFEWKEKGLAIKSGSRGNWDCRLNGMISPCSVVKKGKVFYLYYIGADGNRFSDNGARHRSLGVATSTNGIDFTKYDGNPILQYLPNNNEEEGIFSGAAMLNQNGNIALYYGAMDAGNWHSTTVDSDIRMAISLNGYEFSDIGDVLSHKNIFVYGFGDELFPIGIFKSKNQTYVFYIAKGFGAFWDLGIGLWHSFGFFKKTKPVLSDGSYIIGGGDVIKISEEKIALFLLRDFNKKVIEVRVANSTSPWILSEPIEIYDFFLKISHFTVFYDKKKSTWFLYYLDSNGESIKVMTAPGSYAGEAEKNIMHKN